MGLKTTLFAILMVIVIGWRNRKIADLEGKTPTYRVSDLKKLYTDSFKGIKNIFSNNK
ncbi:MAG: hypothetical protein J6I68_00545 [Butyrivibrio sp.]|uniref:hypothetical protein n=1 Tax=Butyrivibrio sp. TaxID=28121 RepID=UPI001B3CE58B|nr:hypothetical protein [Butyrivibrio sp.]MBP3781716.1 hypothetical protein [Butyrivibrio sp.]